MRRCPDELEPSTASPSVLPVTSLSRRLVTEARRISERIRQSGLFDADWYTRQYPDVAALNIAPIDHFIRIGARLGRDPSPKFSTRDYLQTVGMADPEAQKNPLLHFLNTGSCADQFSAHPAVSNTAVRNNDLPWDAAEPQRQNHISATKVATPRQDSGALVERIHALLNLLSADITTPYYRVLAQAISCTNDAVILAEVWRTLDSIEMPRRGTRPRVDGPLVSIIMPIWNRASVVGAALASVLCQSYSRWELLVCDDGSDDESAAVISCIADPRIRLLRQSIRSGAAAARNRCLKESKGELIAYIDSDNFWHPRFIEVMVEELEKWKGHMAAFASYLDTEFVNGHPSKVRNAQVRDFHMEDQLEKPFVDLNSFVHRRELIDVFGPFDESLERRQDYDLIARYGWVREPLHVRFVLNIYRRDRALNQITHTQAESEAPAKIAEKIERYYQAGVPARFPAWLKKVTVLSWDSSRNHFAKAYSVADALSRHLEVELISFRFFPEERFEPLAGAKPKFTYKEFDGGKFPDFFEPLTRAINSIEGDAIYCVKPRLPSLGAALLANYHTGKPIFLEANDLETVVSSPKEGDVHGDLPLSAILERKDEALSPESLLWSKVMDRCARQMPSLYTHNINLNLHYDRRALYMRNIKDETVFDPALYDRESVRRGLGFSPEHRVILFGGLVRKHKGVFELLDLLDKLGDDRYRLLVVGNRETPDLRKLGERARKSMTILPPQDPRRMAELNLAADLVVLWLDSKVAAANYQSPYKMSDALAMGPAIVGSPVSDLALFSQRELLWMAPFGDIDKLGETVKAIFSNETERKRRQEKARRFFLREFSYNAVGPALALGAARIKTPDKVYPVASDFASAFSRFHASFT